MKRAVILVFIFVIGYLVLRHALIDPKKQNQIDVQRNNSNRLQATGSKIQAERSLFVPYWQISDSYQNSDVSNQTYDRYIYFGVAGTADGIPTDDPGYEHMEGFLSMTKGSRWLTVRMTDSDVNDEVLDSKDSQIKIVNDATRIAKQYGFEGLVLDFEYSSIFGGKVQDVTSFYKVFSEKTKAENLKFAVTLYGDVFYRKRPYDVEQIAKYSDEIMIMAYDLHKSRGEPGPNFPLSAGKKYGYGYDLLFADLEKVVPADKITVIFGMYGYDWKVDEQGRPITLATSITTAQVVANYINKCRNTNCTQLKDNVSGETEINYVDGDKKYHIIWFENEESVEKKEKFLRQRGVGSSAFWAYGYF